MTVVTTNKAAENIVSTDLGIFDDLLRGALDSQPWYRKYANTVTTVYFAILQVISLVIGFGIELPGWAQIGVAVVILVGNVLGIKKTKNGVTDSNAEALREIATEYVRTGEIPSTGGQHRA